ncbi:hypothetical protein ACSTS3_15090 [Aquimarina muelleri]|uniref:hypothetical protein n=1 Tax=Aquimarina muelleri TaxID=279356 RepID=UPI003F68525F
MEKVLNYIICFITVLLVFSCKTDSKKSIAPETGKLDTEIIDTVKTKKNSNHKSKKLNCLTKNDDNEIKEFKKELERVILKKDTLGILKLLDFSIYEIGDMSISQQKIEFIGDIQEVMNHCLKSTMDEGDLQIVKQEEYFTEKEGNNPDCMLYGISNSFPELEFDVTFLIDKIKGEIKIIEIRIIG